MEGFVQIEFLAELGEGAEGFEGVIEKALQNPANFFLIRGGFFPLGGIGFWEIGGEFFGRLDVGFLEFEQLVDARGGGIREFVFLGEQFVGGGGGEDDRIGKKFVGFFRMGVAGDDAEG